MIPIEVLFILRTPMLLPTLWQYLVFSCFRHCRSCFDCSLLHLCAIYCAKAACVAIDLEVQFRPHLHLHVAPRICPVHVDSALVFLDLWMVDNIKWLDPSPC